MRRQAGFGLVEIMIAMTLGLVLGAAIVNVYLESRRSYNFDEELARMQEGGRFALGVLKRELSLAGYMGGLLDRSKLSAQALSSNDCVTSGNWALDIANVTDMVNDFDSSSSSVVSSRSVALDGCLTASDIQDGTDVILVKRTAGEYTLEDGSLTVNSESDKQWYLRIQDRSDYSWSYLSDGNSFPAADKTAGSGVDYWEYYANILYVRNHADTAGDQIPTLFLESLTESAMSSEALVEGVEDVQLEIGVDADDDGVPETFRPPTSASDLDNAVAWRVYILMRSVNAVPGYVNNKAYQLGQKTIAAKNDNFLRRVFTTTVEMGNSKLGV